jgi:hypothetical protein
MSILSDYSLGYILPTRLVCFGQWLANVRIISVYYVKLGTFTALLEKHSIDIITKI